MLVGAVGPWLLSRVDHNWSIPCFDFSRTTSKMHAALKCEPHAQLLHSRKRSAMCVASAGESN